MLQIEKKRFKNRLAEIRKQRGLSRKQVAALLGHDTVTELARLERGLTVPDLRCALKLAQIYELPVRVMLDEYYGACREGIRRQGSLITSNGLKTKQKESVDTDTEYCTYEQRLKSGFLNAERLGGVRRHTTQLAHKLAEQLGHM
jgi:transcriptional regulator with XRE-family HTH domain